MGPTTMATESATVAKSAITLCSMKVTKKKESLTPARLNLSRSFPDWGRIIWYFICLEDLWWLKTKIGNSSGSGVSVY